MPTSTWEAHAMSQEGQEPAAGDPVKGNEASQRPSGGKAFHQAINEADAAWPAAWSANREEATRRWEAEGSIPGRWDQIFEQVCKERPLPPHPLRVAEDLQTWVRGTQLAPDERRYALELFAESRSKRNLSPEQWLEQTAFRLRETDGRLDLRHRYCRLNPGAGPDEPYRYHRAPRHRRPAPPRRQGQREQQRQEQQPQQPDPQLPPVEGQTYNQRVYQAYRDLAEQYRSPDVRIDALHSRLGGSLQDLHRWLRQACRDHLAVPSTGEPSLADHAARQSALTLPGETDRTTGKPQSFLLIKFIESPPMAQQQQPQQPTALNPSPVGRLTRDDLAVIIEALEYRCDAIETGTDFDEVARLKSIVPTLEKLRALEAQPQRPEHERYESLLRATAALRYPPEERTAELEARIEKTIARKVGEFTQERRAKAYEAGLRRELAERHPNLKPDQAQRYERRIAELVAEFRQKQHQPQQEQQQGRGIEQAL